MPNFSFKGKNRQGEMVAGERVAENRGALAMALRREQILLTEAAEKKSGKFNLDFGGNASAKDLAVFTRQFSVMIDAGVPLVLVEGCAEPARLDRRPQPHTLLVPRDVLDLVGHRPAVGLTQERESLGKRLARHVHAQDAGGHLGLELRREPRLEARTGDVAPAVVVRR